MSENTEKPQVSDLTKTLLESGLVDESMAQLLEKWQVLPDGSTQYVNDAALKDATRRQLHELVEKIGEGVENHRTMRESFFDLERLKWPADVSIWRWDRTEDREQLAYGITAVVDRLNRYYFRVDDVDRHGLSTFKPGYYIVYDVQAKSSHEWNKGEMGVHLARRRILESNFLFIGENRATLQVSTGDEEISPFTKNPTVVIDDRPNRGLTNG